MIKMAKKTTQANMFSFEDIVDTMKVIIKPTSIQHVTEESSNARGYISTGIYVLNAAFSGDIYGGIANNRISVLGGPSGVGKSFLCYNICREAQAAGYCIIYVDTEFSIELDQLPGYGIDISKNKFMLLSNNIIEDLKISMTQLLDKLKDVKNSGKELPKMLFVLDSVGQLGSRKEVEDALSGKEKADFTKAKALGSFFRIINADLGTLNIASIFTNHTYKCVTGDTKVLMANGENKEIKYIDAGDLIQTLEGPKVVNFNTKYDNSPLMKITLEDGAEIRCTSEHKFLVKPEWSEDENNECWKNAIDLTVNDTILQIKKINTELTEIKVKSVEFLKEKEDVYDINVADVHHYILDNGVVTHNTMDMFPQDKMKGGEALFYSASSIGFLSKAKLKEGEVDDLDLGQSGIVVTCKMVKNRLAKPKKVKFEISFVSGCNPYTGLDFWLDEDTFEQVGIAKGKWDQKTNTFIPGGNRWYVHHLGTHVATASLFTPKVFTKEVLDSLRPIIKEYFKYKSITELNDINARLEAAKGEISDKELYDENITSSKLFDDED